jgi:hypothetical protein
MQPLLFYRRHAAQVTTDPGRMQAGFFAVADRVAASPERYPTGDARYILATDHLRHRTVATEQARLGDFDNAISSFTRSLKTQPTVSAGLGLFGALICRTPLGRAFFTRIRSAWRNRPWNR